MPALTTTSYAVLALLAVQPWTTYQLARQMERSLGWIWPRAVSRLYEEPKKLAAAGLATSRPGATGRRPSTVYTITPAGRQALANLSALIDDVTAKLHFGQMIADAYLQGRGPFPERLPFSGLMWRFLWEYHMTVLRWARWARDQVQAWPEDLSQLNATAEFSRIVSAASGPRADW